MKLYSGKYQLVNYEYFLLKNANMELLTCKQSSLETISCQRSQNHNRDQPKFGCESFPEAREKCENSGLKLNRFEVLKTPSKWLDSKVEHILIQH